MVTCWSLGTLSVHTGISENGTFDLFLCRTSTFVCVLFVAHGRSCLICLSYLPFERKFLESSYS